MAKYRGFREGFGVVGKSDNESIRVLVADTPVGRRLLLEAGSDGVTLSISAHSIGDLIKALHRAEQAVMTRRPAGEEIPRG